MASRRLLPKSLSNLVVFIWPEMTTANVVPNMVPKHVCRRAWLIGDIDFTSYKDEVATLI